MKNGNGACQTELWIIHAVSPNFGSSHWQNIHQHTLNKKYSRNHTQPGKTKRHCQLTGDVVEGSRWAWILLVKCRSHRTVVTNGTDDGSYCPVNTVVTWQTPNITRIIIMKFIIADIHQWVHLHSWCSTCSGTSKKTEVWKRTDAYIDKQADKLTDRRVNSVLSVQGRWTGRQMGGWAGRGRWVNRQT